MCPKAQNSHDSDNSSNKSSSHLIKKKNGSSMNPSTTPSERATERTLTAFRSTYAPRRKRSRQAVIINRFFFHILLPPFFFSLSLFLFLCPARSFFWQDRPRLTLAGTYRTKTTKQCSGSGSAMTMTFFLLIILIILLQLHTTAEYDDGDEDRAASNRTNLLPTQNWFTWMSFPPAS